jgi:hypothetical protein
VKKRRRPASGVFLVLFTSSSSSLAVADVLDLVFGHPALGTPIDPTKLSRDYMKPALKGRRDHEAVPALARPPAHGAHP